jgi:hypothetical protein
MGNAIIGPATETHVSAADRKEDIDSRVQLSQFRDGKMVERWGSSDQLGMLQQLGVTAIPTPAKAG